jgi:hypothetical protein
MPGGWVRWLCSKHCPSCCQLIPGLPSEGGEVDFEIVLPAPLQEQIQTLQDTLEAGGQADPMHVLKISEGFFTAGIPELALALGQAVPQLVTSIDATSTALLSRAMQIQADSLQAMARPAEAQASAAMAQHLHTLSTRITS